jgi:hypothetical protein
MFIDVGEYGLALDTLLIIAERNRKQIEKEIIDQLDEVKSIWVKTELMKIENKK